MLTLNDGRNELWQWDTGRKLTVDAECSQVHFSNKVFGRSIDVDVADGVADIPDILLQTDKELTAWAFVGTAENGYTKISKVFKVNKRNKPADYVFTPPEQTTLGEIMERLDELEAMQDPDAIKNAVDDYLANNPLQVDEKDPTVPAWAKEKNPPSYSAVDVGAIPTGGDPKANVEFESVNCSDIVGCSELTVHDSEGDSDYASLVYGGKSDSGNPFVKFYQGRNPVILRNIGAPEHDTDAVTKGWADAQREEIEEHVDKQSIRVSGAEVGQLLKVSAVDENGVPTAWESANNSLPPWKHLRSVTIPQDITTDMSGVRFYEASDGTGINFGFDTDKNENPFAVNELFIYCEARNSAAGTGTKEVALYPLDLVNSSSYCYQTAMKIGCAESSAHQSAMCAKCHIIGHPDFIFGWAVTGSSATPSAKTRQFGSNIPVPFTSVRLLPEYNASCGFLPGSKFYFYGR